MEPYKPNEPFIKLKLNGSLLDRMVEAGIPFSRALQYFRDNPEGSAFETLKTAAEDVVPFYGNYRNGGDWSDYAKEAVMLAAPMKGKREYKVDPKRTAEFNEMILNEWNKYPDPMSEESKALEALYMPEYGTGHLRNYDYYKRNWPQFEPYLDNAIYRGIDPLTKQVNQQRAKTLGEDRFGDYWDLKVDEPENIRNADLDGNYIFEDNPNLSIMLSNPKYRAKLYDLIKKAKSNDELRKVLNLEANNLYTEMLLDDLE